MWKKSSVPVLIMVCVPFQNDRYTVGGAEMFDTLTDLVEYYKRKGIEEVSGNWVHFKQVNRESKWKKKVKNKWVFLLYSIVYNTPQKHWGLKTAPFTVTEEAPSRRNLRQWLRILSGWPPPVITLIKGFNFPSVPPSALLLHQSERVRHRQQSQAARRDQTAAGGQRRTEEQGGLLGGVWRKTSNRRWNRCWARPSPTELQLKGKQHTGALFFGSVSARGAILPPGGGVKNVTFREKCCYSHIAWAMLF